MLTTDGLHGHAGGRWARDPLRSVVPSLRLITCDPRIGLPKRIFGRLKERLVITLQLGTTSRQRVIVRCGKQLVRSCNLVIAAIVMPQTAFDDRTVVLIVLFLLFYMFGCLHTICSHRSTRLYMHMPCGGTRSATVARLSSVATWASRA